MLSRLTTFDFIVLLGILFFLTFASLFFPKPQKGSEDYFMAGRSLRWWSVAGSIFGTNISANQIIGMLGVGYTIGFTQSHYEVLAILPILLLAYIFVPLYRRKEVFTLSQFLQHRYGERAKVAYSLIMIVFIMINLVGGFYLGSRQLLLLLSESNWSLTYLQALVLIATVTCIFTVWGGMESVVIADNIQTILMLLAVILVGAITFMQPEINGFSGLMALEKAQPIAEQKMHLYLPTNHPDFPWTGAITGLMILHCFYWTTNQYQVQRVLAAASDRDAKLGVIVAGFMKLVLPFFSVAAGIAAAYIFKMRFGADSIKSDDAFLRLVELVVPAGYGLIGLILAGLISAIFTAIYSMMNSVTTLLSVDLYPKYINKQATDAQTVRFGRIIIVVMCALAAVLALFTFDPTSKSNFFLSLSKQTSYLKPGIVVAFFLAILWRKTNTKAAFISMLAAPFFGIGIEWFYENFLGQNPAIQAILGEKLNFMHRVFLTTIFCLVLQVVLTLRFKDTKLQDAEFDFEWGSIKKGTGQFLITQVPLLLITCFGLVSPQTMSWLAGILTFSLYIWHYFQSKTKEKLWESDLFYAGILSSITVWILYYFT